MLLGGPLPPRRPLLSPNATGCGTCTTLRSTACLPGLSPPSFPPVPPSLLCSSLLARSPGMSTKVGPNPQSNSGIDSIRLYDPVARRWTWTSKMGEGRWYPSIYTLPNGLVGGEHDPVIVLQ